MSRIIVELTQSVADQIADRALAGKADLVDLVQVAKAFDLTELERVLGDFENPVSRPLIRERSTWELLTSRRRLADATEPLERLGSRRDSAARERAHGGPSSADFIGLFLVVVDRLETLERRRQFLDALRTLDTVVASASFEPQLKGAGPGPAIGAVYRVDQGYLANAAKGVGVDAVQALPNPFDGSGSGVADLDEGWNLEHEALQHIGTPSVLPGPSIPNASHGTGVLGIIVGQAKIQGIACGATVKALVYDAPPGGDPLTRKTIAETLDDLLHKPGPDGNVLAAGDVLLIELAELIPEEGIEGLPIEVQVPVFKAIQQATSLGIVVIAVAGNGHTVNGKDLAWDLEAVAQDANLAPAWQASAPGTQSETGIQPWIHPASSIPDSGAIIVSGCEPILASNNQQFNAMTTQNFGLRVDSFGWGSGVVTIGKDNPPKGHPGVPPAASKDEWYNAGFNGTSAAAAIVAGVALIVQEMARRALGRPLSPGELRALLRDQSMGTAVVRDGTVVGVLPDLAKLNESLGRLPALNARALGDAGDGLQPDANVTASAGSPDT
jgi:hypothetical protein